MAVVALFASGAQAVEEERTPEHKALVAYLTEVGSVVYFLGACEPYYSDWKATLRALTGSEVAEKSEFQVMLSSTYSGLYAKGRTEANQYNFTSQQCDHLVKEGMASGDDRRREWEALRKP